MKRAVLGTVIRSYKPTALWIVILAPIALGLIQLWQKNLGEPWAWAAVHHLLNDFEERMFRREALRRDEHSVTLFRYTRARFLCRKPCGRWLVPVERSGNLRRKSKTAFYLAESGGAGSEGVAGQAFSSELVVSAYELPDFSNGITDSLIQTYAEKTFVSEKWLRKWIQVKLGNGQRVARSICAFHVETSAGKPWGVLVLDSTLPGDLKSRAERYYDFVKKHLPRLVERT